MEELKAINLLFFLQKFPEIVIGIWPAALFSLIGLKTNIIIISVVHDSVEVGSEKLLQVYPRFFYCVCKIYKFIFGNNFVFECLFAGTWNSYCSSCN